MSSLDLDLLVPEDRTINVTVAGERHSFPIRGSMPIPKMIRLLRLETRINLAYAGEPYRVEEGEPVVEELADVFQDIYDEINAVVRERTPDAPDLELDENQAMAILGYIAGDESVAQAVTAALVPPARAGDAPGQVVTPTSAAEVAEAGGTPLGSTQPSQTLSSGSEESIAGDRSGGTPAPGVRSDSTSETLTPV